MALSDPFTRRDFQALSRMHLRAARSLLGSRQWQNAHHIAGYAAECALKACIAKRTRRHEFPRRDARDAYTHNLTDLVEAAELDATLRAARQANRAFDVNWTTAKDWTPESARPLPSTHGQTERSHDVDSTTLVSPPNLEEGRKAVQAVKAAHIPLRLGFWAYFTDAREWRLVLITPWLETQGPRATYRAVQKALAKQKVKFPLSLVSLARPGGDPLATVGVKAGRAAEPFGHGRSWNVGSQNVVVNADYVYNAANS